MKTTGSSLNKKIYIDIKKKPNAIKRLNPLIFCEEKVRKLKRPEFEVVYTNNEILKSLKYISNESQKEINKIIGDCFAYRICVNGEKHDNVLYSDKQADKTDIALSGNKGSGRAVYIGSDFNIKGVGRTSLATADINSIHGNGNLDIITALREAVVSNYVYLNTESKTSPVLAVILLKGKTKVAWSKKAIQTSLLIRYDDGFLDRVSHLEYTPVNRKIDVNLLIKNMATFDSEIFCKRIFHGAWSTGNISLNGSWLDMESVSFVSGRGPRCNITKEYISNYFGFESLGAGFVLERVSELLELNIDKLLNIYKKYRAESMNVQFLNLLGFKTNIMNIINTNNILVKKLSKNFENLSKKNSPTNVNLNVFEKDYKGNHLLDFSNLFRNISKIYHSKNRRYLAKHYLLRKKEINKIYTENYKIINKVDKYFSKKTIVKKNEINSFLNEVDTFIDDMFTLLDELMKSENIVDMKGWMYNINISNTNQLNFIQSTKMIRKLYCDYKKGIISNNYLNKKINKIII